MTGRFLRVTYNDGRPLIAYLGLSHGARTQSARTEELGEGLVVDFDADGTPLGLEIINPEIATGAQINAVLSSLGLPEMTKQELSPLPAA